MPRIRKLQADRPWVEFATTSADWKAADPQLLVTMLCELHLIRAFEESVLDLSSEGLVNGPVHSSIGQEGGAVGAIVGLRKDDGINGSHRSHHQFLAKALTYVSKGVIDPGELVTTEVQNVLRRTLAEILGLAQGFCAGRGGSIHLQWLEAGALGSNAIVGGGVPLAAGNAWAQKRGATSNVTVSFFGDGAMNIGSTLETLNLAAAWDLPLCFFVENNLYAVSTRNDEVTGEPRLSGRGPGFGISSWRVNGMDPLAVHLAMQEAESVMRAGSGPTLVEAEVYRFFHQNGSYSGSAFGYRTKEEEEEWRSRDPISLVESQLKSLGHLEESVISAVRVQAKEAMDSVGAHLVESDPEESGKRRIIPSLWPDAGTVNEGLLGDASELDETTFRDPAFAQVELSSKKFAEVASDVLGHRMENDERIVVLGEDVHRLGGGTNGITKRALKVAPDRVLGTPISENAFAGLAAGMALDGRYRPVVELMYPDFVWVAADQIFNQIGKARHMFGANNTMPLVLRTKVAIGSGYGSQHSMDPAGVFATSPGWRIAAPSTAADYVGLMNTALDLEDPVLVLEHVDLYGSREDVPKDDLDYRIPPGSSVVRREGAELTVISYLSMVRAAAEAIDVTDVDAELIDLRWLDAASLDWDTIEASVKKTNAVVIVEQGARGTSYGGWLADEIQRRCFDWLDQPVERVTGTLASPSISRVLEEASKARVDDIVAKLRSMREAMGTS